MSLLNNETKTKVEYRDIKPLETKEATINFIQSYGCSMKYLEEIKCSYSKYTGDMSEDINKIALLKRDISNKFFDIGKILMNYKERRNKTDYKYFLAHPIVDMKESQAKKLVAVYKYIAGERLGQLTGIHIRLGIEKLYLISTVKNNEYFEKLEDFALNKKITVKILKSVVENIKLNTESTIEEAYQKTLEAIAAEKTKKLSQGRTFSQAEVNDLNEKIKQQEKEILELKAKLKQFENNNDISENEAIKTTETYSNVDSQLSNPIKDETEHTHKEEEKVKETYPPLENDKNSQVSTEINHNKSNKPRQKPLVFIPHSS